MPLVNTKQFGIFIGKERAMQRITQEKLGEGIYSVAIISRIERKGFFPEKVIRDVLLERLGESTYDYENCIVEKDYVEWKAKNDLLNALDSLELCQAEGLLQQYEKQYKEKSKVTEQFYLVMLLQWLELNNARQTHETFQFSIFVFLCFLKT